MKKSIKITWKVVKSIINFFLFWQAGQFLLFLAIATVIFFLSSKEWQKIELFIYGIIIFLLLQTKQVISAATTKAIMFSKIVKAENLPFIFD